MAKVDKNTLRKWFSNLMKPTQEQFWHWMDSYWHKDEKIPVQTIEGLEDFLTGIGGNEDNYLLKDGANLDDENRELLRERLGVGDVPDNVATIDMSDEQGSVYTKEQVDDLVEDDTNLGNSDMTIEEGVVRELNVLGRLDIKGLEERENDDAEFSKRIVLNENGTMATKLDVEPTEIVFNVPSQVTINHNFPRIAEPTPYQNSVLEQFQQLNTGNWQDAPANFWTGHTYNNMHPEVIIMFNDNRAFRAIRNTELINIWRQDKTQPVTWVKSIPVFKHNQSSAVSFIFRRKAHFTGNSEAFFRIISSTNPLNTIFSDSNSWSLPFAKLLSGAFNSRIQTFQIWMFKIDSLITVVVRVFYPERGREFYINHIQIPNGNEDYFLQFENPGWDISDVKTKQI